MRFKEKTNKLLCGLLASTMCFGTVMPSTTAYAVTNTTPVNQDGTEPNWNKPQDIVSDDQTQYANQSVRLLVSKIKTNVGKHEGLFPISYQLEKDNRLRSTDDATDTNNQYANTITYKISGRVEGTISALEEKYGTGNIEFAYNSAGVYLGYGWHKGTLEYLTNRKAADYDEDIKFDIIYNEGVFAGYAYVTRALATTDNDNRFVAGANMALYEAIEIQRDNTIKNDGLDVGEDHRFIGVEVTRNSDGTIDDIRVKKGHAGTTQVYVYQKDGVDKLTVDTYGYVIDKNYNPEDQINDLKGGTWIEKTVQKEDTPILYYNLDNLHITTNDSYTKDNVDDIFGKERVNKDQVLYGFDKNRNVIDATQLKETDFSIYGFVGDETKPTYEFVGGDFKEIKYYESEKRITVGKDTLIYHLDEDGNRDSLVDPQTGIAYIEESIDDGKNNAHDNIHDVNNADDKTVKDTKIYVWPVNISYDGSGSTSGNKNGSKTFSKILGTRIATINADKENEYTTGTYENGQFAHRLYPMLDLYGRTIYYKQSSETYVKGQDTWDYDGDVYTGWKYTDLLDKQNLNAYTINDHDTLYNGDKDDPFDQSTHYQYSTVQKIKITIDSNGYIVNGASTVPVPKKENAGFKGWIVNVNDITDGMDIYPAWDNNPNNGMSEETKETWYSKREATGTTRTVTVSFHANSSGDGDNGKAEFVSGSGDIHSTDYKLYRRLGDAYLIYDKWVSGENTPNDPFDTTEVDTVENTAANSNTLTANGKTANDPYSETMSGGMADMLKRIALGDYIMEEVSAPLGYIKGLPVGVTVNYSSEVQTAEMEDKTIKLELVKVDAPDRDLTKYEYYVDGAHQETAAGDAITKTEHKAAFTYKEVTGAVFAITGKDTASKEALSSWAKVTSHPRVNTKIGSDGYAYIEVGLDTPLVLEGFPKGDYVATEVTTPKGAVTMDPVEFSVKEETGVQFKSFSDDHMKVEVEKYYLNTGDAITHLDNARRAQLGLYDSEGNEISTWWTDDLSDYRTVSKASDTTFVSKIINGIKKIFSSSTSGDEMTFEDRFKEAFRANKNFTSLGWTVVRTAEKLTTSTDETQTWLLSDGTKVVCHNYSAPDDAPEAFKEAYKDIDSTVTSFEYADTLTATKDENRTLTDSDMYWNCSNGTVIHIAAYPDDSNSNTKYTYEFEYNYKDLSDVSENLVSYDKETGVHRFDYLPKGEYTIKEINAPDGYVQASDKTITVNETSDIQRFMYENKGRALTIAKYALVNNVYYAGNTNGNADTSEDAKKAAVIPGVKFDVYYSKTPITDYETKFKNGVPDGAAMKDSFETGKDGKYTDKDYKNFAITEDKVGDYKPHSIKDVENGYYYIVERSAPEGYNVKNVTETVVTDSAADSVMNVEVTDEVIPVKVNVLKEDESGARLEGAEFTVINKTLDNITVGYLTTDANGEGSLTINNPYTYNADGTLKPYVFEISETKAPEGYALSDKTYTFTVDTASEKVVEVGDVKYSPISIDGGVITYVDAPTSISISKKDFDTLKEVPGTKFKVSEAAQDEDGNWYVTNKTESDWEWTTTASHPEHNLRNLAAGKTYALVELEVPNGYTKAETIFFTINGNGNAIEKTWTGNENHMISFNSDSSGAVTGVTFKSRQITGATVTGKNLSTGKTFERGLDTSGYITLTKKNDITEEGNYKLDIILHYTDGTKEAIASTDISVTSEDESMKVKLPVAVNEKADAVSYSVVDAEDIDTVIASWSLDKLNASTGSYHTVSNPLSGDGSVLSYYTSKNYVGKDSSAVFANKKIVYELSYTGDGVHDTEILIEKNANFTVTHINGESADKYVKDDGYYHVTGLKDGGTLPIAVTVRSNVSSGYTTMHVYVNGRMLERINPIAVNKNDSTSKKGKIVIANEINGTDTTNDTKTFTYELTLTKAGTDDALDGGYDWRTKSTSGMWKAFGREKAFTFTLTGNDYLVMSDLPCGAEYSVKKVGGDDGFVVTTAGSTEGTISDDQYTISYATFKNEKSVTSDRTVFEKNHSYIVTETLKLSDGTTKDLTKYGFTLNEDDAAYNLIALNKQTEVWFSKTDWTDCEEVEGASCTLYEKDNITGEWVPAVINGQTISWTSGSTPTVFKGTLTAGKTYRYVEVGPPTGYAYTEAVEFTVSEDGRIDKVVMRDKATVVKFTKTDYAGKEVPGAEVELKGYFVGDKPANVGTEGGQWKVIDAWTSTSDCVEHPHEIEGKLTSGMTYRYHEEAAPDGYYYSEDIEFTLDDNGNVVDAHYINKDEETIIYDKDGYPMDDITVTTITTDSGKVSSYKYGDKELVEKDDALYYKDEIKEDGTVVSGAIVPGTEGFRVQIDVIDNVVQMKDAITEVTFTKKDFAGNEVSEAKVDLKHYNKTTGQWDLIEGWTSEKTDPETGKVADHVISGKLTPGETYRYHEEAAPDGYYYSEDIEFTLDNKGNVTDAHYIDRTTGKTIAYDENDYPLEVVTVEKNKDDTRTFYYNDGKENKEVSSTDNGDGSYTITKTDGTTLKVKVDIPVVNNVVQMLDAPIKVKLTKKRKSTNILLSGGVFSIIEKSSGNVVKENFEINGILDLTKNVNTELKANRTYLLREVTAPDGFKKAKDVEFSVPTYSTDNVIEIAMEDPRIDPTPSYKMDKVRVTPAPERLSTGNYGFYRGDKVSYKVTVKNTGDMQLTMTVADAFGYDDDSEETKKIKSYFSAPVAGDAKFYSYNVIEDKKESETEDNSKGETLSRNEDGSTTITLKVGGMAEIIYTAEVLDTAPQYLAPAEEDDKENDKDGYRNTATVKNVEGKNTNKKPGDEDKTYTEKDFSELKDQKDTADTPVQVLIPSYTMTKVRVDKAKQKSGTDKFGFFRNSNVDYNVTVTNTGELPLEMDVTDAFAEDIKSYFSTPYITSVKFYNANGEITDKNAHKSPTYDDAVLDDNGKEIGYNRTRISLQVGEYAVVTYRATVSNDAEEKLSDHTTDDGLGYQNTAHTTNVIGKYTDNKNVEHEITKDTEFPKDPKDPDGDKYKPLEDQEDTANTPVQIPKDYTASYELTKKRITEAKIKGGTTNKYGFNRGDKVKYEVVVDNTGELPIVTYVEDQFADDVKKYFNELQIESIEFKVKSYNKDGIEIDTKEEADGTGDIITENGCGVGFTKAHIRVPVGQKAVLTYTAIVSDSAPEELSFSAIDDGNGYLNIAKTTDSHGETPPGPDDTPGENIPLDDKEDKANTPVKVPVPGYTMTKERIDKASQKSGTTKYGFFRGDKVTYKVTVTNTGDMDLKMLVDDAFTENPEYFSTPIIESENAVKFYMDSAENADGGSLLEKEGTGIGTDKAYISLKIGGKAEIYFTSTVQKDAAEYLAPTAYDVKKDENGNPVNDDGYTNTANVKDVTGTYTDGNGEHTVDKTTEYPVDPKDPNGEKYTPLKDQDDTADTPVQVPKELTPRYDMKKERITNAPEKENGKYGFRAGDIVEYNVTVINTGDMTIYTEISDQFEDSAKKYFTTPVISGIKFLDKDAKRNDEEKLDKDDNNPAGHTEGNEDVIGRETANIYVSVGCKAIITYKATVTSDAIELLSDYPNKEDYGYVNIAKATNGHGEPPEETEKKPPLDPKEDKEKTPVQTPDPSYELTKERITEAPKKASEDGKYGFKHGDAVAYKVTVKNTGTLQLTMDVEDHFDSDVAVYFTTPVLQGVDFYSKTGLQSKDSGKLNEKVNDSTANITVESGCSAVLTYTATVLDTAPEYLAPTAADNKESRKDGYGNTATSKNVIAKYTDGNGEEHKYTKEDYEKDHPGDKNPLKDREDTADTPVQEEKKDTPNPSYTLKKERITPATAKYNSDGKFGFWENETVVYKITVENTGDIAIKTTVSDEFDANIADYFKDLKIAAPDENTAAITFNTSGETTLGEVIETSGMGVGTDKVKIKLEVGGRAEIYFTAIVSEKAKELLASTEFSKGEENDPTGYKNIARAKDTTTVPPDGGDGEKQPPKEDEDHTPVQEPKPSYEMTKERITLAPEKADGKYGFKHGSTVEYLVTVKNTGETVLTMNVSDTFDGIVSTYFSTPVISKTEFTNGSLIETDGMGVGTDKAHITLNQGGVAKITYTAKVLDTAPESLSLATADDGYGYKNVATVKDVTSTHETPDGEKHTKTEKDYPDDDNPLKPKEDDAHTPVQTPTPDYALEKNRVSEAPKKSSTKYGFYRNNTVTYEVVVTNTGTMDLEMLVNDAFDTSISKYFQDLTITNVKFVDKTTGNENTKLGGLLTRDGTGVGTTKAYIALNQNGKAIITYTAKVSSNAPENLSNAAKDDGRGYLNTATTTEVIGKYEDGEGKTVKVTKDDFDTLKDKSDTANTPVQVRTSGGGSDDKEYYGKIVIYKYDSETSKSLAGATFEIYYPDGTLYQTVTTGSNGEASVKIYTTGTYTYKEIKAPEGYDIDNGTYELKVSSYSTYTARVANTKTEEPPVPPVNPEEPEEPKEPTTPTKGKITVHYTTSTDGHGNGWFDTDGHFHKIPTPTEYKTGDNFDMALAVLAALAGFSLIGCGTLGFVRIRKKEEKEKK